MKYSPDGTAAAERNPATVRAGDITLISNESSTEGNPSFCSMDPFCANLSQNQNSCQSDQLSSAIRTSAVTSHTHSDFARIASTIERKYRLSSSRNTSDMAATQDDYKVSFNSDTNSDSDESTVVNGKSSQAAQNEVLKLGLNGISNCADTEKGTSSETVEKVKKKKKDKDSDSEKSGKKKSKKSDKKSTDSTENGETSKKSDKKEKKEKKKSKTNLHENDVSEDTKPGDKKEKKEKKTKKKDANKSADVLSSNEVILSTDVIDSPQIVNDAFVDDKRQIISSTDVSIASSETTSFDSQNHCVNGTEITVGISDISVEASAKTGENVVVKKSTSKATTESVVVSLSGGDKPALMTNGRCADDVAVSNRHGAAPDLRDSDIDKNSKAGETTSAEMPGKNIIYELSEEHHAI